MVKLLILTQYYPPETGAPQNRLSSLAFYLKNAGHEVEVLTSLPNYPEYKIFPEYKKNKNRIQFLEGIRIIRSGIFVRKNKAIHFRLLTYFSFAFNSYFEGIKQVKPPEIIICESPPLFLGITAMALKRKWKCKLVFNVSDLWPESVEALGIIQNKLLLKFSHELALKIYKNADLISGQTKGIVAKIKKIVPHKEVVWLPNGIDFKRFPTVNNSYSSTGPKDEFRLLYAGILGHAQGLEVILLAAKELTAMASIKFTIAGDGPEKENLVNLKNQLKLTNVQFKGNLSVEQLSHELAMADACIVPLKNLALFAGAIPSKIFEPLYFGKPVLLGVKGEAKELFIDQGKTGLYFEPENYNDLASKILQLYYDQSLARELGNNGREYVKTNFNRQEIAKRFEEQITKSFCYPKS